MIEGVKLPEGWISEEYGHPADAYILYPKKAKIGAVTVFFKKRWWNLGFGYSNLRLGANSNSEGRKYVGRGWQQKLVDDAVAALVAAAQQ